MKPDSNAASKPSRNGPSAADDTQSRDLLRRLPKVDRLLESDRFAPLVETHSRPVVAGALRAEIDRLRHEILDGTAETAALEDTAVERRVAEELRAGALPFYRRVVNGTGVILHTGLGRAPLPRAAVEALTERAGHPMRVEIELDTGERGGRDRGCAELLCELTGAPAAAVVNNNAAATLICLAALARGTKVLVSRGELVEIGGSYRIPAIMEESGAVLKEVGTTNRTHLRDYEDAIDEDTGMILKVHTSNYRVVGFTKEVEIEELVELGRRHGLPVVHDLGSGCLIDLERHGFPGEPYVPNSIRSGADLICFSGDKLLGGPQAGLIVGTEDAVSRCRRHSLFRAMRPDRLTYAALEAVLKIYRRGEAAVRAEIPALARLLAPERDLEVRARGLAETLGSPAGVEIEVQPGHSQAGSGSLPARDFPTWTVVVRPTQSSVEAVARSMRQGNPAILTRTRDEAIIFDVRTLDDEEFYSIARALGSALEDVDEND